MEKVSKLKNVQATGNFNELFKFELDFEDGTTGIVYRKTNDAKVEVGETYTYTLSPKGTIKIIPEGKPFVGSGNYNAPATSTVSSTGLTRDELIVRQTCIKAAVDFCKNANCSPEEVTANAQIFRDWIFTEKQAESLKEQVVSIARPKDDLPF
jgi:hypothetical protein|tara:strand:+ start:71 stop:529 length:459 start_codon:yes stop_codon:yes gene_type:complete